MFSNRCFTFRIRDYIIFYVKFFIKLSKPLLHHQVYIVIVDFFCKFQFPNRSHAGLYTKAQSMRLEIF